MVQFSSQNWIIPCLSSKGLF